MTTGGEHGVLWDELAALKARVMELEAKHEANWTAWRQALAPVISDLAGALERIEALEHDSPEARQARHEAAVAMADLRASGWSEEEDYR